MKFSETDKKRIEEAVKQAEAKTSGEIMPMCLANSDFYPAAHYRAAFVFSFIIATAFYYKWGTFLDSMWFFSIIIVGMILGYFSAYLPFIKKLFLIKKETAEEVYQRALQAFLENNLHNTRDRTGILIMISVLEKRVEILADIGINEKASPQEWHKLASNLITHIKNKKITDGLIEAITTCGETLAEHFPIKHDDTNELSNKLITN
ncbi:MAG: TPM domain-containing protein [bacterium]|nr:TPM domain-containing protein [bacterium]MBU1918524.1 TPM domain-containing protein [bacterium]